MPPRLGLPMKRWSPFDLPILPFLAPRAFQPWPNRGRRGHSGATAASQQKSETVNGAYDDSPRNNDGGQNWSMSPTAQKQGFHEELQDVSRPLSNATDLEHNSLQWLEKYSRENAESSGTFEEEEFRRRYEEIWGARSKKQPLAASVRRVQADGKYPEEERGARPQAVTIKYVAMKEILEQQYQARDQARQQWLDDMKVKMAARRKLLRFRAQSAADRRRIPLIRPKWARHLPGRHSNLHAPFSSWHRWFAILNFRNEKFMKRRRLPRLSIRRTSKFSTTFIRGLIEQKSSTTLSRKWKKFHPRRRMEIWPELMIETLQRHPGKALKVIVGTYAEPFPPSYAVSDCLNYIIAHFLGGARPPTMTPIRKLCNNIFRLLRIGPKDYLHISQHSTFLLLSRADIYYVKRLYEMMSSLNHPLHQNTLMHFASRLAKSGETHIAFRILHKLRGLESNFNSPRMLSLCSAILDRSNWGPNTTHSDSDMFEYMLECEMAPNIITYNILLKNSVQIGNHTTAWHIHDMMMDSGIEPDDYTYSILLNDSKRRMDSADITRVMDLVRERGIKNAYIVNDVLHAIFVLYQEKAKMDGQPPIPRAAFDHMLKVYLENFRIEPLARIIPWISETLSSVQSRRISPPTQKELDYPPIPTRALMIIAFLQGLQHPGDVRQFYGHFRDLLSAADPIVADLLQTTHIWNSLLMALGRFPDTLGDCPIVIRDMLALTTAAPVNENSPTANEIKTKLAPADIIPDTKLKAESFENEAQNSTASFQTIYASIYPQDSAPQQAEVPEQHSRRSHTPPEPDVYTWSILLKIFMDHQQTRAAEKVLTMMQEKGIKPNIVTWNTLTTGYARLQDADMTVSAISRLERAGFETDKNTMRSLHRIHDRKAVIEAMNKKEKGVVNPGRGFLDQLQEDMQNLTDDELSPEFENVENEEFVVEDMEDFGEDRPVH